MLYLGLATYKWYAAKDVVLRNWSKDVTFQQTLSYYFGTSLRFGHTLIKQRCHIGFDAINDCLGARYLSTSTILQQTSYYIKRYDTTLLSTTLTCTLTQIKRR